MTRNQVVALFGQLLADNLRGEISAHDARVALKAVTDSFFSLESDRVEFAHLSESVLAAFQAGLDPTKYRGPWDPATNTPTLPAAAADNTGDWYLATAAGTATGNAAGTYAYGDRIQSNGTTWLKQPAPPTVIPEGAVTLEKLATSLRDAWRPQFDVQFVYAIVDAQARVAFGIRPDGTLFGNLPLPDLGVTTAKLADDAVTLEKLGPTLRAQLPDDLAPGLEFVYAICDQNGRVAFGIRSTGELFGNLPIAAGAITTAKLAAGAVTREKLAPEIEEKVGVELSASTGFAWALVDAADRIALGVQTNGRLVGRFPAPADGSVTRAKLADAVKELLPQTLDPTSGYQWALVDQNGRIGLALGTDGRVHGRFLLADGAVTATKLADGAVSELKLAPAVARAAIPHGTDRVEVDDDDGWRGQAFALPARTDFAGSLFRTFAPARVRSIRGVNTSGVTLEFRRSAGLVIRGRRYRGTWNPASGAPDAAPLAGDWWTATGPGTVAGLTFAANDRLVALDTVVSQGAQWTKGRVGELFYVGEFVPATHAPTGSVEGDLWQAAAAGTFSGLAFSAGDLLFREAGVWGKVASEPITSVPNGAAFHFAVRTNAREIEVRRADKTTTRVGLLATAFRTLKPARSTDAIVMWGDSMVATGGLHTALAALVAPRTLTAFSYPGATSDQILAMMRKEARGADAYRGRLHVIFAANNNALDQAQSRECALAFADIAGARDHRTVFLSVIGQHQTGWNGTRITLPQYEDAFAATGPIWELEEWYKAAFPSLCLNSRAELLARAGSTPSLVFPGLTEAQAAATYGAVPFSFFLGGQPWTPSQLIFRGYHSAAGLPAGGAEGDYWLRTANGTVGNPLVRWAGAWTEIAYDMVHMNATGNAALADAIADFLTANSL